MVTGEICGSFGGKREGSVYMNKNLQPITSKARAREIGSLGGSKKTKKKKLAAQLREWRKRGLKNVGDKKKLELYVELLADPEFSGLELIRLARELYQTLEKEHNKVSMIGQMVNIHRSIHGEKLVTENYHQTIDWGEIIDNIIVSDEAKYHEEKTRNAH